jgi:hypothetical protein
MMEHATEDAINAAKITLYIEGGLVLAVMMMAFAIFSFEGGDYDSHRAA